MVATRLLDGAVCLAFGLAATATKDVDGAEIHDKYNAKSGIRPWVDPATPKEAFKHTSSRGETWELVMSDEFNTPRRSFKPGHDHLWTSIYKPDGVNAAMQVFKHERCGTACDDDGTCYFQIEAVDKVQELRLWNDYQNPPGYKLFPFYYEAGMVQSWNKFCFQGGMVETRVQLPGAIGKDSGNPDAGKPKSAPASELAYYPTWPGIWMMGNLGRAIFSASTNRMWPFSYNACEDDVFDSKNQRISACDSNPGFGMHPNQGRGAPEIDILEGGGIAISSSIQVGPGMPLDYRLMDPVEDTDSGCVFTHSCTTKGANGPDLPTSYYWNKRNHKSWYQGLRYGANNYCVPDASKQQIYETVSASVKAGVTTNKCDVSTCSASLDMNADLSAMDGRSDAYWGINSNGTCYPELNGYMGAYLCSAGNNDKQCPETHLPPNDKMPIFAYQMDAISSNWPVNVGAYTDYLVYQIEWVMGSNGYVRWSLSDQPLFEIPAKAIEDPPQDPQKNDNPKKIMIEEPMYFIINVALSEQWGARPPNPGKPCRGDGSTPTDDKTAKICDSFPMYLKIDYIRLYQDVSQNSNMNLECDPKSHPTAEWIKGHKSEYEDDNNPIDQVSGKAPCQTDDDCTIQGKGQKATISTGTCRSGRCACKGPWAGPRCTMSTGEASSTGVTSVNNGFSGEPPFYVSVGVASVVVLLTVFTTIHARKTAERNDEEWKKIHTAAGSDEYAIRKSKSPFADQNQQPYTPMQSIGTPNNMAVTPDMRNLGGNYAQNFI